MGGVSFSDPQADRLLGACKCSVLVVVVPFHKALLVFTRHIGFVSLLVLDNITSHLVEEASVYSRWMAARRQAGQGEKTPEERTPHLAEGSYPKTRFSGLALYMHGFITRLGLLAAFTWTPRYFFRPSTRRRRRRPCVVVPLGIITIRRSMTDGK